MNRESQHSIPKPSKNQLRQFSKEQDSLYQGVYAGPVSRNDVAQRLQTMRRDRAQDRRREQSIQSQSQQDRDTLETIRNEKLAYEQQAAEISNLIQDHETSLVKRIMDKFRNFPIEEHRQALAESQKQASTLEHQAGIKQELYRTAYYHEELQRIKANQQSFYADSQAYLDQYYQQIALGWKVDQKKQYNRHQLEEYKQAHGSLESLVLANGHYIVHAVKPEFDIGFGNNQNINNQSSYQERIAYLLTQNPSICASTFRPGSGDSRIQLWDNFGLVLNSGTIEDAAAFDKGSQATQENRRTTSVGSVEEYQQRLSAALAQGSKQRYNEVIVSQTRVAATFVNLDQAPMVNLNQDQSIAMTDILWQRGLAERDNLRSITMQNIAETAQFFGLPMIVFKNGQAYELLHDQEQATAWLGRPISPQELVDWSPPQIDNQAYHQMARNASTKPLPML